MADRHTDDYSVDITNAVKVLREGGIILYPTDTVWGLGCDATNAAAVDKIYALKQRAESKALITLVGNVAMLERTVEGIPDVAYDLIELSERPITIVYDRGISVASNLLAEDGTLAVRVTREDFSRTLCNKFGRPLVSTSANISGTPTPACFADISPEVLDKVDYVCTSRRNEADKAKASTIMRINEAGEFKIIRP